MTMAPPRLEKGVGVLDKPVIEKTTPGRESEFDLRYCITFIYIHILGGFTFLF